jgi:hypothetical protein
VEAGRGGGWQLFVELQTGRPEEVGVTITREEGRGEVAVGRGRRGMLPVPPAGGRVPGGGALGGGQGGERRWRLGRGSRRAGGLPTVGFPVECGGRGGQEGGASGDGAGQCAGGGLCVAAAPAGGIPCLNRDKNKKVEGRRFPSSGEVKSWRGRGVRGFGGVVGVGGSGGVVCLAVAKRRLRASGFVALERCATARCAVRMMGDLAMQHGYYPAENIVIILCCE